MKTYIAIALSLLISLPVSAQFIAFPEAEVRSILLMTPGQIKQFAHKKEIELFKFSDPIPSQSKDIAHAFLANLPEVDQDLFGPYKEIFTGSTLGVYFSKHNSSIDLESDTILFSSEADRWTIAHEMGHALIDKNRPLQMKKDEGADIERLRNAKEDYEEIMNLYRNLGFFPGQSYMQRALQSIQVWTSLMLDMLYTYELEEVRIEKYLIGLYENEPELKLDSHTYKRSFWYIGKNCTSAKDKVNLAIEVLEYFSSIVPVEFKDAHRSELLKHKKILDQHRKVIGELCL